MVVRLGRGCTDAVVGGEWGGRRGGMRWGDNGATEDDWCILQRMRRLGANERRRDGVVPWR